MVAMTIGTMPERPICSPTCRRCGGDEAADDEDPPPALSCRGNENGTQQRAEHSADHTERQEAPGPMSEASR